MRNDMKPFNIGDKVRIAGDDKNNLFTITGIDHRSDNVVRLNNGFLYSQEDLTLVSSFTENCDENSLKEGFDEVEKPSHYNSHPSGVECRDIIRHESSNIGFAIKYLWRKDLKGKPIQDMKKAIECIKDEIKLYEEKADND